MAKKKGAGRPRKRSGSTRTSTARKPAKRRAAPSGGSSRARGAGQTRARRGGRATGRTGLMVAAGVAVVTAAAIIYWFGSGLYGPVVPKSSGGRSASIATSIKLYTAAPDGKHLGAHTLKLSAASASSVQAAASAAIKAVLKDSGTIPEGTKLRGVTIKGSTAFVDLSGEASTGSVGGSSGEILAIYSIVNTVAMNFPGIDDVQILIDGKKTATLAGHIDISYPIPPDRTLIEG